MTDDKPLATIRPDEIGPLVQRLEGLVDDTPSAIARWLDDLKHDHPQTTVETYSWAGAQFGRWLAKQSLDLAHVEPGDIRRYKEWMLGKWKPGTIRVQLSALRSLFAWVHEIVPVLYQANPVGKTKGLKISRAHRKDPLTNNEVRRLLDTCDNTRRGIRDRAMLHLLVYTGLRAVELQRASRGDLRTKANRNLLWVQGKGRDEADRYVVIPGAAWDAVQDWLRLGHPVMLPDRPLFYSLGRAQGDRLASRTVLHIVKSHLLKAGINNPRKTTHSLRHTAITNALVRGASPLQVQQMAGHASFDTTMIYAHEVGRMIDPAEEWISYEDAEKSAA